MEIAKACFAPGVKGLLAPLQDFLDDAEVSEILINKPEEVFIECRGKMLRFDLPVLTSQYLRRLFTLIANENRQVLSENKAILSGNLYDGSRVQLVIPPASQHETLSIRKFTLRETSLAEYGDSGFFEYARKADMQDEQFSNQEGNLSILFEKQCWQDFLVSAIQNKKTILISGATSSGKTTFLNSCIREIPQEERLITLEDTYEIKLAHQNAVRLQALKTTGTETANITMQDLVQASLRLRPDRIIMGEIRGKEILDFIAACSTGHEGSLATIHASSPKIAFMRMAQLYKLNQVSGMTEADIYKELESTIDIIVQLERTQSGRILKEVYWKHAKP